ncbi:MAG: hypothetical protein LC649_06615 [Bacteroidales bacterium]|nr:hypothetical protein [Bacteroidales bacterium]
MTLKGSSNIRRLMDKMASGKYFRFRSSIYGRVVYIIMVTSLILFVSFNVIFRSVYEEYFNTVIRESGDNISSLVEGSLYYSMLENDKSSLQSTLDIINTMSGIEEVNMYNEDEMLVYSSYSSDSLSIGSSSCCSCHRDMNEIFPERGRSYKILDNSSDCFNNMNGDERRFLMIRTPIMNEPSCFTASCHAHSPDDDVLGSLIIKIPLEELDRAVHKSSTEFVLLAILITIVLVVILIIFTSKNIKNPLNAIVAASVAVSRGDTSTRIDIHPNLLEDMKKVSVAFNNMLDNISGATRELQNWSHQLEYKVQRKSEDLMEAQNELIRVERIASLGKLSASVAHELNNPLSGILVYTKLIQKQLRNPDLDEDKKDAMLRHLRLIETETKRCGDIVKGLLDFSRKDQDGFEPRHLHDILRSTYDLMTHPIKISDINFATDFTASSDLISCRPNQIKQACVAMLVNSTEAITGSGEIIMRTYNADRLSVTMEISDTGSGISPDAMDHIYEPFFSTKHDASGIGLGLAITHGIIENHKGTIRVKSEVGEGTTFYITFPLAEQKELE